MSKGILGHRAPRMVYITPYFQPALGLHLEVKLLGRHLEFESLVLQLKFELKSSFLQLQCLLLDNVGPSRRHICDWRLARGKLGSRRKRDSSAGCK